MAVETSLGVQVGHSFGRAIGLQRAVFVQITQRGGFRGVAVIIQLLAVESWVNVATKLRNVAAFVAIASAADEVVEQHRLRLRIGRLGGS